MPCERLSADDFHGEAAMRRTRDAVRDLEQSDSYASYVKHISRQETLCYAWVLAPLALFLAFYADMIVGVLDGRAFLNIFGSAVESAPYWVSLAMTVVLVGYVVPLTLLAPFCGMFESISEEEGRVVFALFTFADLLGQSVYNRQRGETPSSFTGHLMYLVPRQGLLIGGYLVFRWRQLHWRRSFHIPWSLLIVPIAVAVFGFVWSHVTTPLITSASASVSFNDGLQRMRVSLTTLAEKDFGTIRQLFSIDDIANSFPTAFPKSALSEIWQEAFLKSWLLLLVGSAVRVATPLLQRLEDTILPSHPTTILLNGVTVVGSMFLFGANMSPVIFFACCTYLWHLATTEWIE